MLRPGERVLRQVNPPPLGDHQFVEPIDQCGGLRGVDGKIEGDRDARFRKRDHALPFRATVLDDAEKTAAAAGDERFQESAGGAVVVGVRQDALVLGESAAAVDQVPIVERVEWIEERIGMNDAAADRLDVRPVVGQIERLHARLAQREAGELEGDAETPLVRGRLIGGFVGLGPAAFHQNPAAQLRAASEAIDPADGHGPIRGGGFQARYHRVEMVDPLVFAPDPGRRDRPHLKLNLQNMAGQSHAADGRSKQFGFQGIRAFDDSPVGHAKFDIPHVLAEATIDVVILPVYVGGDHAAEGDELGAGRDGHEPSPPQEDTIQFQQRDAGLGPK